MALSGPLKAKFGFLPCFALGIGMAMLCMFYAIFVLKVSLSLK